ncbi:DNA-binding protein [Corynebacterium hylobatis]|uniref:DNA-binding protein n=1 Tax=Corynebacterium hylobatis TaxID=1859290 RepID=A0A3S0AX38_9CORY|nr:helix-turn-helix domain-containing protein [Corynebacterium hylobatis]RSZ64406.1 DNA-binding protein [Corynebacterium hylobatis]
MALTPVSQPGQGIDRPLSVSEVSEMIGVPTGTLRQWRNNDTGPRSWALGGRVKYDRADVLAWMDAQRAATARGGDLKPAA